MGCSSHSRIIFHSYGDVTFASEGLQILTYARHSWPLSSEGSLAWHTYCDTGHPFIMVIFKDLWHSHLLPSVCTLYWKNKHFFLRKPIVCIPKMMRVQQGTSFSRIYGSTEAHLGPINFFFWNSLYQISEFIITIF